MKRYTPKNNKDYIAIAHKEGMFEALDELRRDIMNRNKHFYLRAAARRLKMEPSTLFKMGKRLGVDFVHWSEIISWKGIRDLKVNEVCDNE
jgi:hypothetical protein